MASFYKYSDSPTIYGAGGKAFSTPEEFFAAGGARDWSGVETIQGTAPKLLTEKAITLDQLQSAPKIQLPEYAPKTDFADSSVAGAQQAVKSYQDYYKEAMAQQTPEQKQLSDSTQRMLELLDQTKGKKQAVGEEETRLGVPQQQQELAQFNADILRQTAEYEAAKASYDRLLQQKEGSVATLGSIRGQQAQIGRNMAADLNLKASQINMSQALALGKQGMIEQGQRAAQRSVDLRYAAQDEELEIKSKQVQALLDSGILDRQEAAQAFALKAKYEDDRMRQEEEKAKSKRNLDLALSLGITSQFMNRNGEIFVVRSGESFSTPEQFFKAANVRSFEEAYSRGLISDINNEQIQEKALVGELKSKYWDAGITMADTLESAEQKIRTRSKIYAQATRLAGGGGGGGDDGSGDRKVTVTEATNLADQYVTQKRGKDGFISPEDFRTVKTAWIDDGLDVETFYTRFKKYINPANPQDY